MSHLPIIVHIDTEVIRAVHGVSDLFTRPSVTIKACYGVSKTGSSSRSALAESVTLPESNGDVSMLEATTSDSSHNGWLIGEQLDKALSEDEGACKVEVRWPFRHNTAGEDWEGREFVLLHLYSKLSLTPSNNTYPLLIVPPTTPSATPLPDQSLYCQMAFENLNVPSLSMLPSPLASLYAMNATTGVVLHIGYESSQVAVVTDSVVRWECVTSVNIGEADCQAWLEKLLMMDDALNKELLTAAGVDSWLPGQKEKLVKEVKDFVFAECTGDDIEVPAAKTGTKVAIVSTAPAPEEEAFDVAKKLVGDVIPSAAAAASHRSKKAAQQAAAKASAAADAAAANDVIVVTIPSLPEREISLGPVRHRLCEPLINGLTTGGDTAWEALGRAVESSSLSVQERLQIWDAVGIVGDMARFKSLAPSLVTYLSPFLLSGLDLPSDIQPTRVRLLTIPDYIANFKGSTSELAPFLGASMVGKVAFTDSVGKHYVTKVDYNSRGPSCIYGVWQQDA